MTSICVSDGRVLVLVAMGDESAALVYEPGEAEQLGRGLLAFAAQARLAGGPR